MIRKYKFIRIMLMFTACFTIAGLKITDARIIEKSPDISSADIKKTSTQLAGITKNSIKYIGHRGVGGLAPENTLPAFELAGKLGFWGAECDVRTTSDGNWMILHDDTMDRMTNGTGKIKDITFDKLEELNIDSGVNIDKYKGLKVPKLEDYLLICRERGLTPVIEVKPADNLQYYDKFMESIKKYESKDKFVVISLSPKILNELRKRDSNLSLGLICMDITQEKIDYVKSSGNTFIDVLHTKITKDMVDICHENNIKVGVWTVNDKEQAKYLINCGVDYLTTDNLLPEGK